MTTRPWFAQVSEGSRHINVRIDLRPPMPMCVPLIVPSYCDEKTLDVPGAGGGHTIISFISNTRNNSLVLLERPSDSASFFTIHTAEKHGPPFW